MTADAVLWLVFGLAAGFLLAIIALALFVDWALRLEDGE